MTAYQTKKKDNLSTKNLQKEPIADLILLVLLAQH